MKFCCRCKIEQAVSEFYRDKSRTDGLTAQCKSCKREMNDAWDKANPEKVKARLKRYVEANPEACKARTDAWRANNPGYSAEYNRKFREANPTYQADYHRANREKTMERVLRRRQRIAGATVGPIDLAALWAAQGDCCGLCGDPIDRELRHPDPMSPSVDHILPLSKGGLHSQDNLQWAHLKCNLSKGARVPEPIPAGFGLNERK